jgi:hypothetical protein
MPSPNLWKLVPLSFAVLTLSAAGCPNTDPGGPHADLGVTNFLAQDGTGYTSGFVTIRPERGDLLGTEIRLSNFTEDNPSGWILYDSISVAVGDEVVVSVAPTGAAVVTRTCTVASRGVQLGYLYIRLSSDPDTGEPVPISCGCGFSEYASTTDPNVCQ